MPETTDRSPNDSVCSLCGLPNRFQKVTTEYNGITYYFCCTGCRQVFAILMETTQSPDPAFFRETELFKECQAKGIIPRSENDLVQKFAETQKTPKKPNSPLPVNPDNVLSVNLQVANMWCPACAWVIDEVLQNTPGVIKSVCNFSTDRLRVNYDPVKIAPDQINRVVARLGYQTREPGETATAAERRKEFIRFALSAFLTMNVMMLSFSLYFGFFTDLSRDNIAKISWPMFFMATTVLVYGGYNFYKKAWAGLTHAAFSMETLIVIGALSAYIYSTVNLFAGSIHLYYDTVSMLITLVLLGKFLEHRAKAKVLEDLEAFFSLMPNKVRICSDQFPDGRFANIDQLSAGDIFRVLENEIVPADGRVDAGGGMLDEAYITGEPIPVSKNPGDWIRSGTRVQQGDIRIRAHSVGGNSTLGQMIAIIERTLLTKTPLEGKTDVILQWFVPIIILLATGTGIVCRLMGFSTEEAVIRAVTVSVISCPCALGIAIPLARVAGISIAGKKGYLVRDFFAFEQAQAIDTMVFDKTGTVTRGNWTLKKIIPFGEFSSEQVLALAAGMECNSDHLIAREIKRQAERQHIQPAVIDQIQSADNGLSGMSADTKIKIGSRAFLAPEIDNTRLTAASIGNFSDKKHSSIYLSSNGSVSAVFVFGDTLKDGINEVISTLKDNNIQLALVSGDGQETTRAVGEQIGIAETHGGKLPQDKVDFIKNLQSNGRTVAMVGDGINDAPAMVQADLSLAVHAGGNLGEEAADITLMQGSPQQVLDFLAFSDQVNRKISQNLLFTFLYNVIAIPIAMSGLLNPLVAVSAMLLSSISVTGNTLLLVRRSDQM